MRIFVLKVGLIVVMALTALCTSLPTVNVREVMGTTWTSPTTNPLYSVFMVSSNDGWAVGGSMESSTIIHWNGASWSNVASPTKNHIFSVFVVGSTDGWGVGYDGAIVHWIQSPNPQTPQSQEPDRTLWAYIAGIVIVLIGIGGGVALARRKLNRNKP